MEVYVLIKDVPVGGYTFSPHRDRKILGVYADYAGAHDAKTAACRECGVLRSVDYYIENFKLQGVVPPVPEKKDDDEF